MEKEKNIITKISEELSDETLCWSFVEIMWFKTWRSNEKKYIWIVEEKLKETKVFPHGFSYFDFSQNLILLEMSKRYFNNYMKERKQLK